MVIATAARGAAVVFRIPQARIHAARSDVVHFCRVSGTARHAYLTAVAVTHEHERAHFPPAPGRQVAATHGRTRISDTACTMVDRQRLGARERGARIVRMPCARHCHRLARNGRARMGAAEAIPRSYPVLDSSPPYVIGQHVPYRIGQGLVIHVCDYARQFPQFVRDAYSALRRVCHVSECDGCPDRRQAGSGDWRCAFLISTAHGRQTAIRLSATMTNVTACLDSGNVPKDST